MKVAFRQLCLLTIAFGLCSGTAFGHKEVVHRKITEAAAESANVAGSAYAAFLQSVSSEVIAADAKDSLSDGSFAEDNFRQDDGGMRSLNHFYDPLTGLGLSNFPIDDRLRDFFTGQIIPVGRDSFFWASTRDCPGVDIRVIGIGVNVNTHNTWSWKNARDKEWLGITAITRASRQTALLEMFRGVGQVVHLLEDASQPEHTRNEQHLFPESPIEKYGGEHLETLYYQHGMLDWRNKGFTKLKDFWDRNLYHGDGIALDEDAGGGAKLGMAEFSNGNFLGARHLFPEYFAPGDVQYYPRPSRNKSTNYEQVRANPSIGLETYTLGNGHEAKGIYIKKNGDGVTVNHLSRINYLGAKQFSGLSGKAFCTIDDQNVLFDYHSILIPKAVEYSAGLLDYFFRGRLDVTPSLESPSQIKLHVINKSEQPMQGGTFSVYGDDSSGNRSLVQTFNNTTLANNASIDLTFSRSASAVKYLLIYKGTIGVNANNEALDPVDSGIAIAVKKFDLPIPEWTFGNENTNPRQPVDPPDASASGNSGVINEDHAQWVYASKLFFEKSSPYTLRVHLTGMMHNWTSFGESVSDAEIYIDGNSVFLNPFYTTGDCISKAIYDTYDISIPAGNGGHTIKIYLRTYYFDPYETSPCPSTLNFTVSEQ